MDNGADPKAVAFGKYAPSTVSAAVDAAFVTIAIKFLTDIPLSQSGTWSLDSVPSTRIGTYALATSTSAKINHSSVVTPVFHYFGLRWCLYRA